MQITNPTPKPPIDELRINRILSDFRRGRTVLVVDALAGGNVVGESYELASTNEIADVIRLVNGHVVTFPRDVLKGGHNALASADGPKGLEQIAIVLGIFPGKAADELDAAQAKADEPQPKPAEAPER